MPSCSISITWRTGQHKRAMSGNRDGDQDRYVSASARDRSPTVGSGKGVERQLNQWNLLEGTFIQLLNLSALPSTKSN